MSLSVYFPPVSQADGDEIYLVKAMFMVIDRESLLSRVLASSSRLGGVMPQTPVDVPTKLITFISMAS